ncbi:MAG: hypothetical protein BACD_04215 [Bacteroides rodentium]
MSPFALIFISILLLTTVGMRLLKTNLISPLFIVFLSWSCIFSGLFFGDLGMYEVSDRLLFLYSLWLLFLAIGCLFGKLIHIVPYKSTFSYDINLFELLYQISVVITPFIIYKILNVLLSGGNVFLALRMANLGVEEDLVGIGALKYFNPIVFVLFLAELYRIKPNESKKKLYVLLFINILFIVASMAKVGVFFLIVPTVIVVFFKKKIKFKKIFLIVVSLFFLLVLVHFSRGNGGNVSNFSDAISDMMKIYLFAGVPAMDQILEEGVYSGLWGEHVFSSFYKLLNVFGGNFLFGTGKVFVGSNGYALVPFPTNVFTVLYVFYVDFGVIGVMFFAFLTGLFATFIYRLAKFGSVWAIILYSHIATSLALQFFSDFIFSMLSQTLQLIFWTYILYHFHLKYRFIICKKSRLSKLFYAK